MSKTGLRGCYLAYPIDQRGPSSLVWMFEQVEKMKRLLIEHGLVDWTFDPGDAFNVDIGAQPDESIMRINRLALVRSDLVIAFLPSGVASVGVPMEIDRAWSQGKHVVVFSDTRAWMLEYPSRSIVRYTDFDDDSIKDALMEIARMERPVERRQTEILPVKVDVPGCLPKRAYPDDAGLDLIVSEDVAIPLGEFRDVPCGVSLELAPHTWGLVTGRSSAFRKRGLLVLPGVIDPGYRGPIFAGVWAQREDVEIKAGERVAQLIVLGNSTRNFNPEPVEELMPSDRGSNGFGSSGS